MTRIFNLNIAGLTFPIRYAITGNGNIPHSITWEQHNRNTLSIDIGSQSNGKLIIELPRVLIDSPQIYVTESMYQQSKLQLIQKLEHE
jgi:hypothetical protein